MAKRGDDGGRGGGRGGGDKRDLSVDERYTQWKSLVPILYDWLANHNLVWPSLSGRWDPLLIEQATYKHRQRLYLSEQATNLIILIYASVVVDCILNGYASLLRLVDQKFLCPLRWICLIPILSSYDLSALWRDRVPSL